MAIDVQSAVVCDLVRIEDSGKYILIGVYPGKIVVDRFPGKLDLTFWLTITPPIRSGNLDYEVRLEAPGLKKPPVFSDSLPVDGQTTLVLMSEVRIEAIGPGDLVLSVRTKGGRWTTAISRPVVALGDAPAPSHEP